jgi:hypothetical protein
VAADLDDVISKLARYVLKDGIDADSIQGRLRMLHDKPADMNFEEFLDKKDDDDD